MCLNEEECFNKFQHKAAELIKDHPAFNFDVQVAFWLGEEIHRNYVEWKQGHGSCSPLEIQINQMIKTWRHYNGLKANEESFIELLENHKEATLIIQKLSSTYELRNPSTAKVREEYHVEEENEKKVLVNPRNTKNKPSAIDMPDVQGVLSKLRLSHLSSVFEQNNIDLEAFKLLEEQDLQDLNLSIGDKVKIRREIRRLNSSNYIIYVLFMLVFMLLIFLLVN